MIYLLTGAIVICIAVIVVQIISIWNETDLFAKLADSVF